MYDTCGNLHSITITDERWSSRSGRIYDRHRNWSRWHQGLRFSFHGYGHQRKDFYIAYFYTADQYTRIKMRVVTTKSMERVIVDRDLTIKSIYSLYYWYTLRLPCKSALVIDCNLQVHQHRLLIWPGNYISRKGCGFLGCLPSAFLRSMVCDGWFDFRSSVFRLVLSWHRQRYPNQIIS